MVATPAIRATIRDDKIHQIQSMMQAGKKHGMQTMNDSLAQLVIAGDVKREDALRASTDPNDMLRLMGERIPNA
jgi:twitching motility protein PilT